MSNDFRHWMNVLCEGAMPVGAALPAVLYHGTSQRAWESIQQVDAMRIDRAGDPWISFTTDLSTARAVARHKASRDSDRAGVVLSFDAHALARAYPIERFDDSEYLSEDEWRINLPRISPVEQYVIGTKPEYASYLGRTGA